MIVIAGDIVLYFFSLYISVISFYLLVLTIASYIFKKKVVNSAPYQRLAVIIPAHNEELVIKSTIKGIRKSKYPKDLYSIFVIADNCKDRTSELAKEAGALVFERIEPLKCGKGQALDWFFRQHKEAYASFDGLVIIDADTLPHEKFLKEISLSLSHPEVKVVQGYDGVLNPEENWRTALASAAFNVFNHLRPAGHNRIGGTAGLRGNGMAFMTEIIKKYGWPAHSVVEDMEFSLHLLLEGILVHYNPDAIVYAEMPVDRKQAEVQRIRWEGAIIKTARQYIPLVLRACLRQHKICYFDALMDLLVPPLSVLILGQLLLLILSLFFHTEMVPVIAITLFVIFVYVFSGLALKRASIKIWLYLLTTPFFIIWKIILYLKMIISKNGIVWEKTPRQSKLGK